LNLFPFQPDWSDPVTLRLRASTELAASDSGREERTARWPLVGFGTRFTIDTIGDAAVAAAVARFMRENIGQSIYVPLWSEAVPITDVEGTGGRVTLIKCDPGGRLFRVGGSVALWAASNNTVIAVVAEIRADALRPAPVTDNKALYVVPLIATEPLGANQTLSWLDAFTARGEVEFNELISASAGLRPSAVSLPEFRGLPIWPLPFDWEKFDTQYLQNTAELRDAAGLIKTTVLGEFARLQIETGIGQLTREELALVFAWFDAVRGRRGRFWLPSDKWDIHLAADMESSGTELKIAAVGAADLVAHGFAVLVRDLARGAWYARRVTEAVAEQDGTETLTLEEEVPALTTETIISALLLARLDTDDIELKFAHTDSADAELAFVELPDEYAEVWPHGEAEEGTLQDDGRLAE